MDKSDGTKKIQEPYRKTMGEDKDRRKKSIERLEHKLKRLNMFLEKAKPKMGTRDSEKENIHS
jgi:hypothetical protein